ncbi:MAG TPA: alcohol dehydrogenase catalytic domain-containing protein [Thermoanaerobaculia bacterium]|nr:alcohol dehydrogenase catalytic domain-containing protein [Thermoanaerobaculia bacterium]
MIIPETMQAVVKTKAAAGRDATEVKTMPVPNPGPGEVLLKVLATAVCGTDRHIYDWDPSIQHRVRPPRITGHEFCGEIAAFGPQGERPALSIGAYASAEMHVTCGYCRPCRQGERHVCENTRILGLDDDGCFAQYVKVPAENVVLLDRAVVPPKVGAFLDALGNAVHTTQVVDLSGKSVAILGFGPIGAFCAEIARISGASAIAITDVSNHAVAEANRWKQTRGAGNVRALNVRTLSDPAAALREALGGGADVVLELSGAEPSINLGLEAIYPGGWMSLLGLPKGNAVTLSHYSRDLIYKGVTMKAIIGRQVFATWVKMLDLLKAGLKVDDFVSHEFEGLDRFHEAQALLADREAMKVVFYPNGKP